LDSVGWQTVGEARTMYRSCRRAIHQPTAKTLSNRFRTRQHNPKSFLALHGTGSHLGIEHLAIEEPKPNVRKILDTSFYPVAPANQIGSQSQQA
jgi:hypothetical protein